MVEGFVYLSGLFVAFFGPVLIAAKVSDWLRAKRVETMFERVGLTRKR